MTFTKRLLISILVFLLLLGRAQRAAYPSSDSQSGHRTQRSCAHCRQTSHASNDCPSLTSHACGDHSRGSQNPRNDPGNQD